jgi:hypothetical protein
MVGEIVMVLRNIKPRGSDRGEFGWLLELGLAMAAALWRSSEQMRSAMR